jgi:trigger factor
MNILFENVDKVSALLTIQMEKADYEEKVNASLKDFRKKANMPGFRPGQVPMGMLKKRFGKEVTAEEVNKLLGEKLYGYIKDNNINMLGEPLPNEERQKQIDFDTMESFEFVFDIALAPEFKAELTSEDAIDYYTIDVDDEMVNKQVDMYRQRGGNYNKVDVYQEKDMVKGLLAELDENGNTKEGGIQVEGAVMLPDYMKSDDEKAKFAGCKVNDVLVFNPNKAYDGHDVEISSLLKIKKEDAAAMTSDFSFQVEEITRFTPAELNQDLFDQVMGEGAVKSEEEFRAKVKESLAAQFVNDSDYKFMLDVRTYLTGKVGKLEYPDALLKRIMRLNNADKDEKFVEENYDKSIEELTWHLIKEQLVKTYEIKVEQADVMEAAKEMTRMQFAQYGMVNVPDEVLENYAKEQLKKKEQVDGLVNRTVEHKLGQAIKTVVKLNAKTVSLDEFNKLFA